MPDAPLTRDPAFGKLGREIARFANHTNKLLRASQRHRDILEEAAAWSEGAAPLDRTPENPRASMRAIDKFARIYRHRRPTLFGAYFAHHHLRTQAELSRTLLRESFRSDPGHRIAVCHRVHERAESIRREWVSALLELSILEACPEINRDDFAAFNVGALTDHEDVDLAIVVSSVEARDVLASSLGKVNRTFLRYASKIQLFLTEELSTPRNSAMLEEYEELLDHPTRNVVSITQLLGAQRLCGNPRLGRALRERVISRYYAGQGNPIIHEGFLRSVMNELQHHLLPNAVPGVLSPKREIYVPAKLATAAARVVHGVHESRPAHALRAIAEKDPEYHDSYTTLADAFVQNEVLRWLLFLYVVQSDVLDLSDPAIRDASKRVALLLGLKTSARRSSEDRLFGAYMDIRARALRSVATLSLKVARHLGRVSMFRGIVERRRELQDPEANFALRLLEALEDYKGGVFWDEVIELISGDRGASNRFLADFARLSEEQQDEVAICYVDMMCKDAASLIEFLILVAARERFIEPAYARARDGPIAHTFWRAMIRHLSSTDLESFIIRFDTEAKSEALFRLANAYSAHHLAELADLIEDADDSTRGARVVRTLRSVIVLVHHRSNAIGRFTARVLGRTPEFLQRLGDSRRLKELTNEILTQAAREPRPRTQIELLGDAFDVAALRCSLTGTLEGTPADSDDDFVDAVDRYVRELFKACFRDVRLRSPMFEHYRPGSGIAVYATGGYGRGEAFGGDWDYIAVMDKEDKHQQKFFGKVLQRVSAAMTRRGLLPHNRFAAYFNTYVVSLPALKEHLLNRTEETFVDEAEILEARFLLGDPAVARRFNEEIRGLVTGANAQHFIKDLLFEIADRRRTEARDLNLKSTPGGLRELHLLWLALRVVAQLPGPLVPDLLPSTAAQLPQAVRSDLRFLMIAQAELRRARDLYRLIVAFDDNLEAERIVQVAEDLPPLRRAGIRDEYEGELRKLLSASAVRIDRVARAIADASGVAETIGAIYPPGDDEPSPR